MTRKFEETKPLMKDLRQLQLVEFRKPISFGSITNQGPNRMPGVIVFTQGNVPFMKMLFICKPEVCLLFNLYLFCTAKSDLNSWRKNFVKDDQICVGLNVFKWKSHYENDFHLETVLFHEQVSF